HRRETAVLAPVNGPVPDRFERPSKELAPVAEYIAYRKWCASLEREIARLEAVRSGAVADVDAANDAANRRKGFLQAAASRLASFWSGEADSAPDAADELAVLDTAVATATARAEITAAAAAQLDRKISDEKERLVRLKARRPEFLQPAL